MRLMVQNQMLKTKYRYVVLKLHPSPFHGTNLLKDTPQLLFHPHQNLCDELEAQEEQAEAVLKEVGMVSSVASPQVMEALSVDCRRLREAISHTKDLIHLKREERDKGLIQVLKGTRSH